MFKPKEYIGISLEGDSIKVARVVSEKNQLRLIRVDQLTLVEPIKKAQPASVLEKEPAGDVFDDDELDADLIFGLDDDSPDPEPESKKEGSSKSSDDDIFGEIDLDDLDADVFSEDENEDLVSQSDDSISNEKLIYDYLTTVESDNKQVAVNIPAGDTVFQFLSDLNYSEIKKKEVLEILEEKLYALYNRKPNEELYDFKIRDDGTLIIGSVDNESPTLKLMLQAGERFNLKSQVQDVLPDESVMMGMYRTHYEMNSEIITALLQIGKKKSRLLFMKGDQLLQVSPVINEGFDHKNYLSTIFSKILFQIDTGEVPALDQLIIFNNGNGKKVTDFFQSSFSELNVEEFAFNSDKLLYEESLTEIVPFYTTAIGLAEIAAKGDIRKNIDLSFLPSYVVDQQKIFRLQWHGVLLLVLIGLSPIILNFFYQQNSAEIDSLQLRSNQLNMMIADVNPLVTRSEELSQELSLMQDQLNLLRELNEDNIRWTVTMDRFNRALQNTGSTWITSFRQNDDVLMVDGYSLFKDRIPLLAGQFETVTLLNVRKQELRERDIFSFSMMIREVVDDRSLFTPGESAEIQQASTQ
ncbi:hypothetical protein DYD21_06385 [Rhodohalobacter sp. SW132]|uniref:PilN domain-containing protein n=1 Tax=Rhodohalobacter sp. SW132 TaxID=2293433 RepID=UPI000E287981|nr:PilN domain-containing protein [Rhodohalobacter sp. SW132]REL38232.1 hypothetical protein DYD21_06385 [Rhodohalobacter sp. SW132]